MARDDLHNPNGFGKQDHASRGDLIVIEDEGLRNIQGFTQVPNFLLKHPKLSAGGKLCYSVLLSYAWQDTFCFPAQQALARDLNCSVRQVQRYLSELRKERAIDWTQRGLNRPNVYRLKPLKNWVVGPNPLKNKDTTDMSHPDTTWVSEQDTTSTSYKEYTKKNIQHTRVFRSSKESNALVAEFHRLCEHPSPTEPLHRELLQAASLIRKHGLGKARYIVRYAVEQSHETNFRMQHFGAVLAYASRAVAAQKSADDQREGAEKVRMAVEARELDLRRRLRTKEAE